MSDESHTIEQAQPTGMSLAHIADRVIGRPLLLHPDKAAIVMDVLSGRLGVTEMAAPPSGPFASRFRGSNSREDGRFSITRAENGVAIISIVGSLVNRGAWIGAYSGMTSYEGISAQVRDAMADPAVRAIVLDIDSPGGEAFGVGALADQIRSARDEKPVVAVVNDVAASAAYYIASAASEIVISETSLTGSIGVVMVHQNVEKKLEMDGIEVTLIHAGANKVDGHPFAALPEAVRADLQAEINKHYTKFTEAVAAGRSGRLSAEGARGTEARVFLGSDAIAAGLADRIASLDEVIASFNGDSLSIGASARPNRVGKTMEQDENTTPNAVADAARAEGHAAGAAAERERISAILNHAEAEGRADTAVSLALETDLTADQAGRVLAKTPKADASSKPSIKSIEERHGETESAGGEASPSPDAGAAAWGAAIAKINQRNGISK